MRLHRRRYPQAMWYGEGYVATMLIEVKYWKHFIAQYIPFKHIKP